MSSKQPNLFDSIERLFKSLFRKKSKSTSFSSSSSSSDKTVIPTDLKETKNKLFPKFDRIGFYNKLKKQFPERYKTIYRIMALETRYFDSGQFVYTGSAGMEVHKDRFPWGWSSASLLWTKPEYHPIGYKVFTDSANRRRAFLAFKTPMAFAAYLDIYLKKYRPGRWRSTDPAKATAYENTLQTVKLPV